MEIAPAEFVSLLVLQSTSFCNIDCSYCYLSERSKRARMDELVIAAVIERLLEANLVGSRIAICWHAGEPLSLPVTYYERAIELIRELLPPSCEAEFKFQTNGTLISPDWCELFRRHSVQVGVSVDGPLEIHDAARKTRAGGGTFERTMRGIGLLQKTGVDFHVICVLTANSLNQANTLFDFFQRERIRHIGFNIEETEGVHRSNLISQGSAPEKFRHFYREYLGLAAGSSEYHRVREIENPFQAMFLATRDKTRNQQVTPFAIVTVDVDGNLSTFSPELIGTIAPEFGNFKFGNVLHHSIAEMKGSVPFRNALQRISGGVDLCRRSCEYFPVCGGGAPSNKFFENGALASSETEYCRAVIKTTADVLLDFITVPSGIERRVTLGAAASDAL